MKTKHGLFLLAAALALPLSGFAQQAPPDDPSIQAFDKAVAATPSIAKDIDLTLDVIGFDIRKGSSEEKQLADTAAAGVGKYYPSPGPRTWRRSSPRLRRATRRAEGAGWSCRSAAG